MIWVLVVVAIVIIAVITYDIKTEGRRRNCEEWSHMRNEALKTGDMEKAKMYTDLIRENCEKWYLPQVENKKPQNNKIINQPKLAT